MKRYILKVLFICFFLISSYNVFSQENNGFNPNYQLLHSNSVVQDKNFYLLTAMQQVPAIKQLLISNKELAAFISAKKSQIIKSTNTSAASRAYIPDTMWDELGGENSEYHFKSFLWTEKEVKFISKQLRDLYSSNIEFKEFIQNQIRPSGYYQNYINLTDEEILIKAWVDAAKGINHIINVYGKGMKPLYPKIDSISYNKNSIFYRRLMDINANSITRNLNTMSLFFEPSLQFALNLLDINDRDNASSYEPMAKKENKATVERIATIDWNAYKYSIILVPGEGPTNYRNPLNPIGKFRLKLAVEHYRMKLAPIIVVSGGKVHPYRTPYAEALEMKKFLMERYQIPENAILIEPHARHTTTNFRNTARLIYRYGIPSTKKALVTTTKFQSYYISSEILYKRCIRELGYVPYKLIKRLNQNDIEFLPVITSLQSNSMDPLDP